jgi:hypothetical protein
MQFMTTWTLRDGNGDSSERIAEGKKILEAFSRWTIPEGESMIAFVARADGSGGCAISETNDVTALADAAAKFSAWYTWEIVPVMDLSDPKTVEFLVNASTFHD